MGLKDDIGETGIGGGTIWAKGPALSYISPMEMAFKEVHKATQEADLEKLTQILDEDPSLINLQDYGLNTPAHLAARCCIEKPARLPALKFLIQRGADLDMPDMHGDTPLILAAMSEPAGNKGSVGACKALVEAKADLTMQEKNFRMTALHWAANGGKIQIIKELLAHPMAAEVKKITDREGMTPKERAEKARYNSEEATKLFK